MAKSEPTLPIPDGSGWMTRRATAVLFNVHVRTVDRMIKDGVLHSYRPTAAPNEKAPILLFAPQVHDVHAAMIKLGKLPSGEQMGRVRPGLGRLITA